VAHFAAIWLSLALLLTPHARAAPVERALVISPSSDAVSLSVYRNPDADTDSDWPSGYALITETRSIDLPAGEFVLRFEGVADGLLPESAIVSGLPSGVREKNRDARLLSPAGLVDAYLKRTVHIRRTNQATGVVREMTARITAAPNGAVVLESDEGFEALHCTGLPERMLFAQVPADLSAKPSLSVLATSTQAVRVQITLSYLAQGFDWSANYLATVRSIQHGKARVDLFAWLTIFNGSGQSFIDAQTRVVAGRPNRVDTEIGAMPTGGALELQCWPTQRTHDVPLRANLVSPPPEPRGFDDGYTLEAIVVTGSRLRRVDVETSQPVAAMVATQENLGDLKLYSVPEPVTVNAHGQKQVALMVKPDVKLDAYYAAEFFESNEEQPMLLKLRGENIRTNGMGLALPTGAAEVFQQTEVGPLWLGASDVEDLAVGEKLDLSVADASDVRIETRLSVRKNHWQLTLSNAKPYPVHAEVKIASTLVGRVAAIKNIDGVPTWKTSIPANSTTRIEFVVAEPTL
jgi:hypothetical protein